MDLHQFLQLLIVQKKESDIGTEKIPVRNCNGRALKDHEAEAIKIINKENTYILTICHN